MPEPLSQDVLDRIATQFPEADQAEVAQVLLGYCVAPINFGRLMILDAVRDRVTDVPRFVKMGNRYGKDWEYYDPPFSGRQRRQSTAWPHAVCGPTCAPADAILRFLARLRRAFQSSASGGRG